MEFQCGDMPNYTTSDGSVKIQKESEVRLKIIGTRVDATEIASQDKKSLDVGANLFVGNLDPDLDEKLFYDTFTAFGVIVTNPKAELRASVFEAIEEEDRTIEKEEGLPPALLGSCNDSAKQLHASPSGDESATISGPFLQEDVLSLKGLEFIPEQAEPAEAAPELAMASPSPLLS